MDRLGRISTLDRLGRIRAELRPRAVLVGVAVTFGAYVPVATVYVLFVRDRLLDPGAVAVVAVFLLLTPPLSGGVVAGYLTAASRGRSVLCGWAAGFVSGFLIGYGLLLLVVIGTRVGSPPPYAAVESVKLLVIAPSVVGVVAGLSLSAGSAVGGLLGFEVRRRREDDV